MELNQISVVIVTHGHRLHLIRGCLKSALEDRASRIIVVCNGVSNKVAEFLTGFQKIHPLRVELVVLEKNQGSAGGFHEGLKKAYSYPEDPILLLDDDNWIKKGTISKYLTRDSSVSLHQIPKIFLAFRPVNESHSRIIEGNGSPELRIPGAAGGLDFVNWCRLKQKTPKTKLNLEKLNHAKYQLPSGTYGGLFLPKRVVEWKELPNKNLVLYGDDIELTERLVQRGAIIELCPEILLPDVEMSRNIMNATAADSNRLKYHYRNMIYLDRIFSQKSNSRIRFTFNFFFFILHLIKQTFINGNRKLSIELVGASFRGLFGRLGPTWKI